MGSMEPKDGDYAALLAAMAMARQGPSLVPPGTAKPVAAERPETVSTPCQAQDAEFSAADQAAIDEAMLVASGRTQNELRQLAELEGLPPISDEELARQAEAHPGADGDPRTPE